MRKFLKCAVAALLFVALGLGLHAPPAAHAGSPSSGATIPDRAVPKDGSGNLWTDAQISLGYKVFVATSSSAIAVTDEAGNLAVAGLLHMICTSSGSATSDWAVAYDSSSATAGLTNLTSGNQATNVGKQLTPLINRATAGLTCQQVDAQFNFGLALLQLGTPTNGTTHVYWRPSTAGRN